MMRFLRLKMAMPFVLLALLALTGCTSTRSWKDASAKRRADESNSTQISTAIVKDQDLPARQHVADSPTAASLDQTENSEVKIAQLSSTEVDKAGVEQSVVSLSDLAIHPDDTTAKEDLTPRSVEDALAETGKETASRYTLSLAEILLQADSQNPNIALARERINEAYARVDRAEALWLPSLRAGLNYNYHEGEIQDVAGHLFQTTRNAFSGGFGANTVGAASPAVPGLLAQFHLTDAIFQPKIASHQAASRQFGATAARNDVLRDAAVAYLEIVRAEHSVEIARQAFANTEKLSEITRQFSETGQGLQSDYQRMEAELAIRAEQVAVQQEVVIVASAKLAQILHADATIQFVTNEPAVTPLDVISLQDSAASFVVLGLSRRPELCEQKHLVCEAIERLNREKYAPLIPSVLLGMSYGSMGGGVGSSVVTSGPRFDTDAVAYWELRNLGAGDRAARNEANSAARQAKFREVALLDKVAREVMEAYAQVQQRKKRLELASKGIVAAERSYQLNLQRIENVQGLPIEVLQSIQALASAQRAYLNAVVDFNIAQFELCRATGWFVES